MFSGVLYILINDICCRRHCLCVFVRGEAPAQPEILVTLFVVIILT